MHWRQIPLSKEGLPFSVELDAPSSGMDCSMKFIGNADDGILERIAECVKADLAADGLNVNLHWPKEHIALMKGAEPDAGERIFASAAKTLGEASGLVFSGMKLTDALAQLEDRRQQVEPGSLVELPAVARYDMEVSLKT